VQIRNPLAGVCGLVELLMSGVGDTPLNTEQMKFLTDIKSETVGETLCIFSSDEDLFDL
jgi:hypothetical protein